LFKQSVLFYEKKCWHFSQLYYGLTQCNSLKSLAQIARSGVPMTSYKNKSNPTTTSSSTTSSTSSQASLSYKRAGVDVRKGDALVDWLIETNSPAQQKTKSKVKSKTSNDVVSGIGGFAALFRASFSDLKSPLLVSSTDGVGTKVKLAAQFNRYEGVGQDLVAMCVNDVACVGARPLFFLDYYACARLEMKVAQTFLKSVKEACEFCDCVLIGGETAEMPGVYRKNDFDCAGFSVGVVDEEAVLGAQRVKNGDRIIGVSSSGFHSNGYSLLRKVFARDIKKWADKLLTPTYLYSPLVQTLLQAETGLHAVAHVTGGGLDNLLRVVPTGSVLDLKAWSVPDEFLEVKKRSKLKWPELLRTLNCGIGLVLFVDAKSFASVTKHVGQSGFKAYDLGTVNTEASRKESAWQLATKELG
jgi:phosphoribosylformylglycinamidine cyclo-ligase